MFANNLNFQLITASNDGLYFSHDLLNNFTELLMLKVEGRSAYRSGPLLSGTRTVALYCG